MNRPITYLVPADNRHELQPVVEYIRHQLQPHLLRLFKKRNSYAENFVKKWWQPPHWHFENRFTESEKFLQRYHDVGPDPYAGPGFVLILGYSRAERAQLESYYLETVRSGPCKDLPEIKIVEATAYAINALPDDGCPPLREMGDRKSYHSGTHPIYANDGIGRVCTYIELTNWNPTKDHFFMAFSNCLKMSHSSQSENGDHAVSDVPSSMSSARSTNLPNDKLMACPRCGNQVSPQAVNCTYCGQPIAGGFFRINRGTREKTPKFVKVSRPLGWLLLMLSCAGFVADILLGDGTHYVPWIIGACLAICLLVYVEIGQWWHQS